MDTLNMGRAMWRNKIALIPVIVLTLLGIAWALFLMPKTYQVQTSLLIMPPPPAPSQEQKDKNPELARINSDNPYARRYDPTILIKLVSVTVTLPASRAAIRDAGGDERFTVVQASTYGFGSPFADVTSVASSPQEASQSNRLIIQRFRQELKRLQSQERDQRSTPLDPRYFITAKPAADPSDAKVDTTGVVKVVLQIFGLGVFGAFAAVSVSDALREARRQRKEGSPPNFDEARPPALRV